MNLYEQYKKNKFTLALFGIEKGEARSAYFCTPRGASILGWTGVDGIHYCKVNRHSETIFAVDPYADPKKHAFPVAEDFETFLRLLITCGHESMLEQAHAWTREQYEQFVSENPLTSDQKAAADAIAAAYSLKPMEDAYTYLKNIYDAFDFDTVPYKKDYYEWVPAEKTPIKKEWRVYYSTAGSSGEKGERAGRELPIGKHITFAGYDWFVPCAYICSKGVVLDMLAEVSAEDVRAFHEKWGHTEDDGSGYDIGIQAFLTEEERLALTAQNPFGSTFTPILIVNGRPLRCKRGSGNQYVSDSVLQNSEYAHNGMEEVLKHYSLSMEKCWMLRRFSFPWETASKPKIKSIGIKLRQKPVNLPDVKFRADAVGQQILFTHPLTKAEHTLTVTRYESGEMNIPDGVEMEMPTHYTEMAYTVTPDIPTEKIQIKDTRRNDPPRHRRQAKTLNSSDPAVAIGIIGGADGPTVLVLGRKKSDGENIEHTAISAVTYEKQESVEWMVVFCEVLAQDVDAQLI